MRSLHYIELHKILEELKVLEKGIIEKIYEENTDSICFKIYKKEKFFLRYIPGKAIYLDEKKFEVIEDSFVKILRERIERERIEKIDIVKGERVVYFETKNYKIYFELFSEGNIILTNKKDIIITSMIKKDYGWRKIFPNERYVVQRDQFDPFKVTIEEFKERLINSKKKDLVRTFAIDFKLGGLYAEELLYRCKINKDWKPGELSEDEIKKLYDEFIKLLNEKNPSLYKEEFSYTILYHLNEEPKSFNSFNDVLREFYNKKLLRNPEEEKYLKVIKTQEEELKKIEEEIKKLEIYGNLLKDYGWLIEEIRKMILNGKNIRDIEKYLEEIGVNVKIEIRNNKLRLKFV